jgi:hypothetical protein
MNALDDKLDTCGCCEEPGEAALENRPGLPALQYRLGTHATFLRRLEARLANALPALTTRAEDDPSIALLDAGAVICDILTFYQERIANEGYLRTATERRSVLELAREIGYELNPGVAAGTYLAFTVEDPIALPLTPPVPNLPLPPPPILIPTTITVPLGTKVQSVPGEGQLPQTFETAEQIQARVSWNAIKARQSQRQQLSIEGGQLKLRDPAAVAVPATPCATLWLAGTATGLNPGDLLVVHVTAANIDASDPISLHAQGGMVVVRVAAVSADDVNQRTRVALNVSGGAVPAFGFPERPPGVIQTTPVTPSAAAVRARVIERSWDEANLAAFLEVQRWDAEGLAKQVNALNASTPKPASVYVFRQKAGFFGSNAPPAKTLVAIEKNPWVNFDAPPYGPTTIWRDSVGSLYSDTHDADVFLERALSGIIPGSLVGATRPGALWPEIFSVRAVSEMALADFAISGKATGLQLNLELDKTKPLSAWTTRVNGVFKSNAGAAFKVRTATLFAQAEALPLSDAPLAEPVATRAAASPPGSLGPTWQPASSVMLDRLVLGLAVGQIVALSGALVDGDGKLIGRTASELATLDRVQHTGGFTVLEFKKPLTNLYERSSFAISANVARATHGERQPVAQIPGKAQEEILGDGDGALANQSFDLKQLPLTYVSAAVPSGGISTLTLRVNGVAWTEVASLYEQSADARVFSVRIDDDGSTRVTFGDGVSGSRLPTGKSNVTATYRKGIGLSGHVLAGQLTLLQSRPLGLKNVINPVPASGAQDPESLEEARVNAARTVRTLDRVVSLADYADFARSFAGIGKAQALEVWSGQVRLVHLTVASATGLVLDPLSDVYRNLLKGLREASDPSQPVQVDSFVPRLFNLTASLIVEPNYDSSSVLAAARAALRREFSFAARAFAQPVTEAEIMAIFQRVEGVTAVRVTALHATDRPAPPLAGVLAAAAAHFDGVSRSVLPAELLTLHPAGLSLSTVAP